MGITKKMGRAHYNSDGIKKGKAGSNQRRAKRANKKKVKRILDKILVD